MAFDLTADKVLLNVWISVGAAGLSFFLCTFVLLAAAWIYSKPSARHTLDRVSFRLFLWSMVFEVFYDWAFIAVGVESSRDHVPNDICATGVYFMMSTLGVVNYLCTCIALNLMLIVCFKINPLEKRLERWYVGVSIFLGMAIPIIPAGLDHFGWDPILNVCWIKADTDVTRMKYFVLDLYLWQTLSCLVATLAVAMTLVSLFNQRRRSSALDRGKIRRISLDTEHNEIYASMFDELETKFLKIACCIALYPISLIVVNGIITIGDLYISAKGGVKSKSVYGLYCIYYFLYGGRGIFFAILGIFVDPCLRDGLKAAWRVDHGDSSMELPRNNKRPLDKQSLLEILGAPTPVLEYDTQVPAQDESLLSTPIDRPRMGSKSSIDMSIALSRLPHEVQKNSEAPLRTLPTSKDFTKSFSGVRAASLPLGLTDEVDVQRVGGWGRELQMGWDELSSQEDLNGRKEREQLEELKPDLPSEVEEKRRRNKAAQVDREEALRMFEETQAQL